MPKSPLLLLADVGGTNIRCALCRPHTPTRLIAIRRFHTAQFSNLGEVVNCYLQEVGNWIQKFNIVAVAMGIPGFQTTSKQARFNAQNINWMPNGASVLATLGLKQGVFVNDFQAAACSILLLSSKQRTKMGGGRPWPQATRAVLGAGTGLGAAILYPNKEHWHPLHCEFGNTEFAPRGKGQMRLLEYLYDQPALSGNAIGNSLANGNMTSSHVTVQTILSGSGLVRLYHYLLHTGKKPSKIEQLTVQGTEAAAAITKLGLEGQPVCREVLSLFCQIYGAVAGNFALTSFARGGVYLAGGITQHLRHFLPESPFREAFEQSTPMYAELLKSIPVYLPNHPEPALVGAAYLALQQYQQSQSTE